MRSPLVAMVLVVAAFTTMTGRNVARADERIHAALTYAPDADIERCPSERELRDAVAARLGYDPFVDAGPGDLEVVVTVRRRGAGIVGQLELRGPRPGRRELASPRGDCRELLDSFAVAIAIGIDPASLSRPPAEPPAVLPAPLPSAAPSSTAPVARDVAQPPPVEGAPVPPAKRDPIDVRLGAGPLLMFGELPEAAPGLAVTFGARWRWLEPSVEGLATLPVSLDTPNGRVSASLLAVGVVPCGHVDVFFGCLGVTVGALRGEGEAIASPLHGSQLYAAASGRAGVELALSRSVWVRGHAEAVAPMTRITLQLAAQDVWRMPSVAARAGLSAGVLF